MSSNRIPSQQGLYDPQFEHDACGVGFVVHMKGKKSHAIVDNALTILLNLDHRGAVGAETNTGDGAGILLQVPHRFLVKATEALGITLPEAGQYGVGMIYASPDRSQREHSRQVLNKLWRKKDSRCLVGAMCRRITPCWAIQQNPVSRSCNRYLFSGLRS